MIKIKSLRKYCPAATGTAFSPKFILDAEVQNSVFWNIANSGCVKINLKSDWACSNTKIFRKCEIKRSELSYKWKCVSSDNLGQRVGDKFTNLSKTRFSMECFTADFFAIFYQKASKIGFWVGGWVLAIESKHFGDYLQIS